MSIPNSYWQKVQDVLLLQKNIVNFISFSFFALNLSCPEKLKLSSDSVENFFIESGAENNGMLVNRFLM